MSPVRIASLVEGDGEVEALPILLRRVVQEIDPLIAPVIPRPFRHPSGSILRVGGLERAINAVAELHPDHSILVLVDCDDDCPKTLGPVLARRAREARPDLFISVVLAHREYESWFLAAAESLAGKRNLDPNLAAPENPEDIRDAKGWLSRHIQGTGRYSPTQDQTALSHWVDFGRARSRSRSFGKFWKEIEAIVRVAQQA
ncbi:MAG: DUF4276 family protein [Bryobacteraceae bacterium]